MEQEENERLLRLIALGIILLVVGSGYCGYLIGQSMTIEAGRAELKHILDTNYSSICNQSNRLEFSFGSNNIDFYD